MESKKFKDKAGARNICILYSGGINSVLMDAIASSEFLNTTCVYYNFGEFHSQKEMGNLPNDVLDRNMSFIGKNSNQYVESKNACMIMAAATEFSPDEIWLGSVLGEMTDHDTDKNVGFQTRINNVFSCVPSNTKVIQLMYPLAEMSLTKLGAVRYCLEKGLLTIEQLKSSLSCTSNENGHCGKCIQCARRFCIFTQMGIKDDFNVHPFNPNNEEILKMVENMKNVFHDGWDTKYTKELVREILPTLIDLSIKEE